MNPKDLNWYNAQQSSDIDTELINELGKDKWTKVDSSFIDALAYHRFAEVLEVRLNNGQVYTFMEISQVTYDEFLNSPSKGRFFQNILKRNQKRS